MYFPEDDELEAIFLDMIEKNIDINEPIEDGEDYSTPIYFAVYKGNLRHVRLLLEHGANVSRETLCVIPETEEVDGIFKLLVENGADFNEPDDEGTTAFHSVLNDHDLKSIKILLDNDADINITGAEGQTALHYAAENPHVDVIEYVLDRGFDVNGKDDLGGTALHIAADRGTAEACELLLRRGAAVNAEFHDMMNATPLHIALLRSESDREQFEVVQVLLEYGANLDDEFSDGSSDGSVLRLGAFPRVGQRTRDILTRHVVRMQYSNSNLCESDGKEIEKYDCYKVFYYECIQEFERMKLTKFYNNVSIFSLLMDSEYVLSGYARNEELVQALEQVDYDKQFPIYFTWLKKRFYAQVEKQKLQKYAAMSISGIFKLNDPFHAVTQKILGYLEDEDLKFL